MTEQFQRELELLVSEFATLPERAVAIVAYRAVMRVLPVWGRAMDMSVGSPARWADVGLIRNCIIAGLGAHADDDPEIYQAAWSAYGVVDTEVRDDAQVSLACYATGHALQGVDDPGLTIADRMRASAAATISSIHAMSSPEHGQEALARDMEFLRAGQNVLELPLWHAGNPVHKEWADTLAMWQGSGGALTFFANWYQKALDGRAQDWSLLRKIALVDGTIWGTGGETFDTAVSDLLRRHALAATANAERIEPNPDTGRLRLVPDSQLPQEIAAYARRKIIKATEVFDDSTGQAYGALAPDLAMLRRAVADAGNLPLELLDACASATRRLAIRIDTGDCPAATQDPLIADYQARLRETGADILASDPEAQKVMARRAAIEGDRSLIDARQAIEQTVATVAPLLEGRLAETLPLDAQTASDPDARPDERAAASFRLAGRLLRIERALPFAADVRKGIVAGNAALLRVAKYLQAIEFFATLPSVKAALAAIYRFIGL